jgi:hypothetical protein
LYRKRFDHLPVGVEKAHFTLFHEGIVTLWEGFVLGD